MEIKHTLESRKTSQNAASGTLLTALQKLALQEGRTSTYIQGLTVYRASQSTGPFAVENQTSICVVAQGRKQVEIGDRCLEYNPMQYLVVSLPVPVMARILDATQRKPLLSLILRIDLLQMAQLVLAMPEIQPHLKTSALCVSPIDADLTNALIRLLHAAGNELEAKMLGNHIVHEILFRVLSGEQGKQLRAMTLRDGAAFRVAQAVQYIQEHYPDSLDVDTIAKSVCVSSSTLHHNFKDVIALSPIQYLKQVRLHRSRLFLLAEGVSVGEAAYRVGYNSLSQFSREFKRMFGILPSQVSEEISQS